MKEVLTKCVIPACAIILFASDAFAQQETGPGIAGRLDYYSTYLWRGTYSYGGDGAFCPSLSYTVPGTGAAATILGEFSESYFFEGEKRDRNQTAFAAHGLNFGLDYSQAFNDTVTLGAGLWYYWYFNSATADATNRTNYTFLTARAYARWDGFPLKPVLTACYDYYTAIRRGGDFYITLGVSHEFALTDQVSLGLSLSAGYYYQKTAETTIYSEAGVIHTPIKKGVSDIIALILLKYGHGHLGFTGGMAYVAVPAETWHKGQDIHRFFATFGVSFTL